ENALRSCMNSGASFPYPSGKINPALSSSYYRLACFVRAIWDAGAKTRGALNKTQSEKPKKEEGERDFFCRVSDAFRVFARHSSFILGSAWAFAGAVLVIAVWLLTGPTFHFSDT